MKFDRTIKKILSESWADQKPPRHDIRVAGLPAAPGQIGTAPGRQAPGEEPNAPARDVPFYKMGGKVPGFDRDEWALFGQLKEDLKRFSEEWMTRNKDKQLSSEEIYQQILAEFKKIDKPEAVTSTTYTSNNVWETIDRWFQWYVENELPLMPGSRNIQRSDRGYFG